MKLQCLLIDDEPPALKVLESHIAQIGGLEVVAQCSNAIEAMDILHSKPVDVMFLDIKMPKIIGTRFLQNLPRPPKVIFVTAYREYAVDAYELDAVDYLVKPVSFERFFKAVNRLKLSMGTAVTTEENVYRNNPAAFVYLKVDKDMQKIFINDIRYIESWRDYVKVFQTTSKYLLVKQSISSIESLLSEHRFLRIHRSYIISSQHITSYNHAAVQLHDKELPIGRLYKPAVMERLNKI